MGCSCNRSATRTNTAAKKQVSKPRPVRTIVKSNNGNAVRVLRRVLDRY